MKRLILLHPKQLNFWLFLVFITGVLLCSLHFFGRSSMWFDELTSALNVQHHSYYQLATEPLDYNQVAPVGFLFLEKFATSLFGENDFAFRFFPWIWSLVSLVLFLNIARYFIKGPVLVAAFILFACSVSHWFYGGEAKQYSGDITAALFLVWSALQLMKDKIHQSTVWLIACLGFLLIIASLPAIVIAPLLRCIIFIKLIKKQVVITKKYFSIIAICWAIAWAGQEKTDNWFHNAREYTEKFIHQQQIRDAVGKQALFTRELFYPLLDTFMLGLPHTYRKIIADRGTAIRLKVQTDIGGEWTIIKTDTDWQLTETENISPVSTVSINPDTAWKLFSKGITPEEAGDTIEISGDKKMGETALQMVSVMA